MTGRGPVLPKAPYLAFVHERVRLFACYPVPLLARPRAESSAQENKSAILYYTHRLAEFADPGSPSPYLWVFGDYRVRIGHTVVHEQYVFIGSSHRSLTLPSWVSLGVILLGFVIYVPGHMHLSHGSQEWLDMG